ncbi:MAG: gliding motility lipoprotein GldH [Saprospiraceae bacterium]|nr:gliding motility lipoprotein GldH [Saprospiraceae bacterium]
MHLLSLSRIGFLSLLSVLFFSCGPDYLYENTQTLESEEWSYADSISFEITIADTSHLYELVVEVEHATVYPRQNLYTRISTDFPDGTRLSKPVSLELADKTGFWYGDCNSDWCSIDIPIQTNAFFNQAGTYRFTLEQFTRIDPLPGVRKVGFAVRDLGLR